MFGVLIVNLVTAFRVSIFQQFLDHDPAAPASADALVERLVAFAFEEKAFSLFALLFGIGLAIQYERLARLGRPLYWLVRRLAALLVFGLIHLLLVWNGDILTQYAVAGLLVLPFLLLPAPAVLLGALSFLALYAAGPALYSVTWPDAAALERHVASANQAYATGSFAETWRFSLGELPLLLSLHLFVFPRTIGLFLIGVFLWRARIVQRAHDLVGGMFIAAVAGIAVGAGTAGAHGLLRIGIVFWALGYGAALLVLAQLRIARRFLSVFAPIGRMAFTNYLLQSIVFGLIFFGYGFGQFGRMGAAAAFAIGVAVYIAQLLLSRWWLRRYRFGPLEWLWRTLMYGVVQPMRRAAAR